MNALCKDIFKELIEADAAYNPNEYGFELFYSPECSCRPDTPALVLTINPKVDKEEAIRPTFPWPKQHAFFAEKPFRIKRPMQKLFAELNHVFAAVPGLASHSRPDTETFASTSVVAASLVPFRTSSESDITTDMRTFSEGIWRRILSVWTPRLTIAIGKSPYAFMRDVFAAGGYTAEPEQIWPETGFGRGITTRSIRMAGSNGKTAILAYFPHFSRYQPFTGKSPEKNAAMRRFLKIVCSMAGSQDPNWLG